MTVPTVEELKVLAAEARGCQTGVTAPSERLLAMIEGLPPDIVFATNGLLEQVVSRALVARAFEVLNAGPGSAGIGGALLLLREALS